MKKSKIKSVKKIGSEMAYNVTMKSDQHNYAISDGTSSIFSRNSHSAAYAVIAYQTAFLKVKYPIEFMCALLTSELRNPDKIKIYLQETKRMGIEIRSPNINKSTDAYKIERGLLSNGKEGYFLRTPLTAIDGIGQKAIGSIVASQPFQSFKEFLGKIDARQVNKKVFASLVNEGCMDDIWGISRHDMINRYEETKKIADKEKQVRKRQEAKEQTMIGNIFDMDTSEIKI